jgi:transcriptional regulator with XRE-family HTH domain
MALADFPVPEDTFGARLAIVRQVMGGWNVKRTADFCGIDDQRWRNWENGRSTPRDLIAVCRQIAEACQVNYPWLIGGGALRSRCFQPAYAIGA